MEAINNAMASLQNTLGGLRANTIVYGVLAIFLGVYGPRLHPRLPPMIRNLFNHPAFRTVVILLVVYLSSMDLQLALLVTIAFLLVSNVVNSLDAQEHFQNKVREAFENASEEKKKEGETDLLSQMGQLTQPPKIPEEHPGVAPTGSDASNAVKSTMEQFKQFEEYLHNTTEAYQGKKLF